MITAMQLMLSQNVSFIEKSCEFTPDCQLFGRKTFAETEDLVARNFLQDTGELMIELEMRNIHNLYECYMRVPKEGHQGNHRHNYHSDRMESTYFLYGLSDWSVSLFPDSSSTEADGSVAVQLQRHSSFDHLCCVRYRVILGDEGTFDSGDLEQILDASGVGEPFTVGASVSRLARGRSTLRVKVEMISVVYVSEASVSVMSRSKNRAHLYDRDKQAWMLEADTSGKFVAFKLYYTDISHVPRKFTRYVAWHLRLLTRGNSRTARPLNGPFNRYYVQQELDDGFTMKTDIPVEEVSRSMLRFPLAVTRSLQLRVFPSILSPFVLLCRMCLWRRFCSSCLLACQV